jgi:hypothetical protein
MDLYKLFKSREYLQCEYNIYKSLSHRGFARIINADWTHPCNNNLLTEKDIREIFNRTERKGYHISPVYDVVCDRDGIESAVNVGLIISPVK